MTTDKVYVMGPKGPEKMPGWHSWRHPTRLEQDASRALYQTLHGRAARQRRAQERENRG